MNYLSDVNRVEVIDHTTSEKNGGGRAYTYHQDGVTVKMSVQDGGKTLKVFIKNK